MGAVELSVSDLARSLDYWQNVVGLRLLSSENGYASLGTDAELIRFVEEPGARPADGHTGLYHVALLVPDRVSLARWLAHAARGRVPLEGLSDHAVSEAIYLRDPDRHGIEIYADRPREQWDGKVSELMTTLPLDVESLLGELEDPAAEPFEGLPDGTTTGHVHLRIADVGGRCRVLPRCARDGTDDAAWADGCIPQRRRLPPSHRRQHVGEPRRPPAPPGSATLRHATIVVPDAGELARVAGRVADAGQEPEAREDGVLVRDPSQNALLLASAGT